MITITHLTKRFAFFLVFGLLALGQIQAQMDVSYDCVCENGLADGVVKFKIRGFGAAGETWTAKNAVHLYMDEGLTIPLPDSPMLPQNNNAARYCLDGYAAVNVLPTVDICANTTPNPINLEMTTCSPPTIEILPDPTENVEDLAVVCAGSARRYCFQDLLGQFDPLDVVWEAPGSSSLTVTNDGRCATVEYPEAGAYLLMVTGISDRGCMIRDDQVVLVQDLSEELSLTGECEVYTCDDDLSRMYTLNGHNGATEFKLYLPSSTGVLGSPVFTTTGSGTGSGTNPAMVTVDPIQFAGGDGDYVLIACNDNPNLASCDFDVRKEITVRSMIDTVSIIGSSYLCMGESDTYTIENPELYGDVTWTVDPATGATLLGNVLTINDAGTYTLTASGLTTSEHPNFSCEFSSTMIVEGSDGAVEQLACNNRVNVTLNSDCELTILPSMILKGETLGDDAYVLEITQEDGTAVTNPIPAELVNEVLIVSVQQKCADNSCWGELLVEDKTITPLDCPTTAAVTCEMIEVIDSSFVGMAGLPNFDIDSVYYTEPGPWTLFGHDNCSTVELTFADENVSPNECSAIQTIERTWTVTDPTGAQSTCTVRMSVAVPTGEPEWPPHWDSGFDQTEHNGTLSACNDPLLNPEELECGTTYTLDDNGNPHPDCTGYPSALTCSRHRVLGYNDRIIGICGESKKILRNWTVWDECRTIEYMYTQIITLMNNNAPICNAPDEAIVGTDIHDCGKDSLTVLPPKVSGTCDDWSYTIKYKLNDDSNFNLNTFSSVGVSSDAADSTETIQIYNIEFERDSIWIAYVVTDDCGRTCTSFNEIRLEDIEDPIPACDLNNTITLNEEGWAYATPATFDDNSWDNCGVHQSVIRRMDNDVCECEPRSFQYMNYLGEYAGHHYYLSKDKTDALRAHAKASALSDSDITDAYLVTIDSMPENVWLQEQLNLYTQDAVLIGLSDGTNFSNPRNFQWHNDSTFVFNNWDRNEPADSTDPVTRDNHGKIYTVMNPDGTWNAEFHSEIWTNYVVEFDTPCGFTQLEKFCCGDVGQETMVQLRVIDNWGNHNFCMVNVKVTNPGSIGSPICPPNMTLNCSVDLDTIDFGVATMPLTDDCTFVTAPVPLNEVEKPDNSCSIGEVTRMWAVYDIDDREYTCTQRINFVNTDNLTFDGISWPKDTTVFGRCFLGELLPEDLPEGYQEPTWDVPGCSSVISSYEDLVFFIVDGACQKMTRTWSVVDWCDPAKTIHSYTQVIKLQNTITPSVRCPQPPTYVDAGNCDVRIDSLAAGLASNGACIENVSWSYSIDFNSGDPLDTYPDINNISGNNLAGVYPLGTHEFTFNVTDDCGNESSQTCNFTFRDNSAPIPYCHGELVLPLGGRDSVFIWASDVDLGSEDFNDCSDVTLSFSDSLILNSLSYDCDDLGPNVVTLYVWDDENPNVANISSCIVHIIVQDNIGHCGPVTGSLIAGNIRREDEQMIDLVEVNLNSIAMASPMNNMALDGTYAFESVPMNNDYEVVALKNDNYLNGVSTLDLVMIQRHILGIQALDSPYKIIAADINNSASINGIDLVELRKLILGIYTELPQNDSWRFVNTTHVFPDMTNPFPYEENVSIANLNQPISDADFIGVKIGDVNLTATANSLDEPLSNRNNSEFNLELVEEMTATGNTRIKVVMTEAAIIAGTQFNMDFTGKFLTAIPGELELTDQHIAWDAIENQELKVSWNSATGKELEKGAILFEFLLEGSNSFALNQAAELSPEMYLEEAGDITVKSLRIDKATQSDFGFVLEQNKPNPFKDVTTIGFYLPQAGMVNLSITNMEGRLVLTRDEWYDAGPNELVLESKSFDTDGVLYYQLSSAGHTSTKKMIILK